MYRSKIANVGTGFTNQIFALITSIINAYKKGCKVVVVDNFLDDINKTTYTPITNIFNIQKTNIFLQQNYNIIMVDKNNINLENISIKYGTNETNYIDLTDFINQKYLNKNKLFIDKNCIFNDIKGDPCLGIIKKIIMNYKINDYYIEEIYDEKLKENIEIDFDGPYEFTFGWINSFNNNMFDKILTNITYNNDFILKSELILKSINIEKKINVIHLMLEDDGIEHWSRINNLTKKDYKTYLEEKYINLIKKYTSNTDENIILSNSLSNGVIDFLDKHHYNYKFIDKFFNDREKNAIVDLLSSKYCNNIFIGNFNLKHCNGSTFSYYISKIINENITKIYIDLDKIYDKEVVVGNSIVESNKDKIYDKEVVVGNSIVESNKDKIYDKEVVVGNSIVESKKDKIYDKEVVVGNSIKDKVLVLFVFHIYNDRVENFINNCIFKDENVDFFIISNDKNNKFEVPHYVKCLFRDNIGYDFGAWSDALLINNLYENYDKFIFVNSSVIGPFVPSYYKNNWTDIYINGLQNNIKLFGSTINTCNDPLNKSHVQSYIFSMDKTTLKYLINCEIFSTTNYAKTFKGAISNKEILMSRKIIENNWNIGSLLAIYNNVDFTFRYKTPKEYNITFLGDVMFPQFKNSVWNIFELVFIKGNRVKVF